MRVGVKHTEHTFVVSLMCTTRMRFTHYYTVTECDQHVVLFYDYVHDLYWYVTTELFFYCVIYHDRMLAYKKLKSKMWTLTCVVTEVQYEPNSTLCSRTSWIAVSFASLSLRFILSMSLFSFSSSLHLQTPKRKVRRRWWPKRTKMELNSPMTFNAAEWGFTEC
jgi:hypothetical protein